MRFGFHDGRGCGSRGFGPRDFSAGFRRGPFEVRWSVGRDGSGDRGFRGGGGGRGRRRVFDSAELRLVLLKLIAEEARHGYDLIRAIEAASGGAYAPSPGIIYPTLTLLQDQGHVDEQRSEGAKRVFAITDAGRADLDANADAVDSLFARLSSLAEEQRRGDPGPVRRAMHNLHMALRDRLGRADASEELLHEVAEMLDEVTRRIERR